MAQKHPWNLHPLKDAEWPAELGELRDGFLGQANVYRVMAHHPHLLKAWTALRQHVVVETSLGRARSEVVILRAAARTNAPYEWAHHVVRGREAGLSDTRIASLRGELGQMDPADRLIAEAVDQLFDNAGLSPELLQDLHAEVGPEGTLDLMATVGFYSTLAFILNSFNTEIDENIAASLDAAPLSGPDL